MQCSTAPVFSTIQPIGCEGTSASRSQKKESCPTLEAAQKRARDLKAEFPMLQVKVYDAAEKKLLELPPTE
jgi:hypothetical protein